MEPTDTSPPASSPATDRVRTLVAALTGLSAIGSAIMAIAHMGIYVPVPGAPDTARVILPAAISFAVGTLALVAVILGLLARRRWAWVAGIVVHAIVIVGSAYPVRGWPSIVAIVISAAAVVALLTPSGRALRRG